MAILNLSGIIVSLKLKSRQKQTPHKVGVRVRGVCHGYLQVGSYLSMGGGEYPIEKVEARNDHFIVETAHYRAKIDSIV